MTSSPRLHRAIWVSLLLGCGADDTAAGGSSSSGSQTTSSSTSSTDADITTSGVGGTSGVADESSGGGSSTGGPEDPPELAPLCPEGLPFVYERPDEGMPLDDAELALATTRYLELLDGVRWFDFVDERVHGWPKSDPRGRDWYGTWWSGVDVIKQDGAVTYRHPEYGSDNNGLRTGPVLEGICYGAALWHDPAHEMLVRRMMRGMVAWIRAMEREPDDPDAPLLCRAFYPESIDVDDDGLAYRIDYDLARPGPDDDTSWFVHIADNPEWGDVYIKNKRSKDDIGHMLRAIAQVGTCVDGFTDPETLADFADLRTTYAEWTRRVEDDGWKIYTLDKDAQLWFWNDVAHYFIPGECASKLAIRLLGRFEAGDLDCGNGIGPIDDIIINGTDHNGNILRSFHEAAANNALLAGENDVAQAMFDGLALRIVEGLDGLEGTGEPVPYLGEHDLFDMMVHSAAVGVPLTSREVRWLHARIDDALASYTGNPDLEPMLHVFDPDTPDGTYGYEPTGAGIHFISLGALLGTCASPCANPAGRPVLDCDLVAAR